MVRNNLKKIRKNMNISSEELASRAGISFSTYNKIEKGRSKPMLETALKIARILRTPIEILFYLEDEK